MPVLKKVLRNVLREPLSKATPAPVYAPDLDLKFAQELRLDPRVDFSRGSNATVADSDGTLKWAGHNLEVRSDDFGNWTLTAGSVTANQIAAPDGTTTADLFVEDTDIGVSRSLNGSTVYSANTKYFIVVYIKNYSSDRYVQLSGFGLTANGQAPVFDPVNGTVDTNLGSRCLSASITDVGNGWYKCVAEVISTSSSNFYLNIGDSATNNYGQTYTGNGTSGVYIWGAHAYKADKSMQERTDVATGLETYYPTTSAAYYAPRFDHDPATNESLGLLIEESRTNLVTDSETFNGFSEARVSRNFTATTSPDGILNAIEVVEDTNTNSHSLAVNLGITSGATCSLSVFMKQGQGTRHGILRSNNDGANSYVVADLTNGVISEVGSDVSTSDIQNYGNGWYRVSFTYTNPGDTLSGYIVALSNSTTPSASLPSYTGDGSSSVFLWGAQFEEGAFPTSYIPTSGSSVTRSADVADMLTSDFNFSATEGTLFVEADTYDSTQSFRRFAEVNNDSTFQNSVSLQVASGNLKAYVFSGGSTEANLTPGSISDNAFFKGVIGYQTDNVAGCIDGGSVSTDTSATMPVAANLTHLNIGTSTGSGSFQNGHIKQLTYYARRLDDATLQALTQPSLEPSLNLVFDSSETSYVNTGLTR